LSRSFAVSGLNLRVYIVKYLIWYASFTYNTQYLYTKKKIHTI